MQRGLGEAVRSWGGSAVLGRQRGLGEAARSWGGSAVLGRQRGLGGSPHSRFAVVSPMSNCCGSPRRRNLITLSLYGWSAQRRNLRIRQPLWLFGYAEKG